MTLTEFNYFFKRFVRISILCLILFFIGKFSINYLIDYYKRKNPLPPTPPEAKFGKIKPIKPALIPIAEGSNTTYVLDNKTGKLPTFTDRLKVYPFLVPNPTILSEKRSRDLANKLGFLEKPIQVSSTLFVWKDNSSGKTLKANTVLESFEMTLDMENPPFSIINNVAPSNDSAIATAISFLNFCGLYKNDLGDAQKEVTLLKIEGKKLIKTDKESANITKVDFLRKVSEGDKDNPIESLIYASDPTFPLISVYVVNDGTKNSVAQFNYIYWDYDIPNGSSYPLNTVENAWGDVKNGQGLFIYTELPYSFEPLTIKRFEIRDVEIVYLESAKYFEKLMPYYLFSGLAFGNNNESGAFKIVYPALRPDYLDSL